MNIFCCTCRREVNAVQVSGMTLFPRRPDVWKNKFYQCPYCLNYTSARHDIETGEYKPIGFIASPALRTERIRLHELFDPIWKNDPHPAQSRKGWYKYIACGLYGPTGKKFHFGELKSFRECQRAETMIHKIKAKNRLKKKKSLL